jgi:uncharacterized repeat protein (TIGR03803 family)
MESRSDRVCFRVLVAGLLSRWTAKCQRRFSTSGNPSHKANQQIKQLMKRFVETWIRVLVLIMGGLLVFPVRAQSFTNLHAFASNGDGANPWGALVLSHNTLYGTTAMGGAAQGGTIYAVNTDGSGYTNLHDFTTADDGGNPYDGLTISGNTLYGTASVGGTLGYGNVYSVNTDGSNFKIVYSFGGTDGSTPWGGLVLSGNTLYGTTKAGGALTRGSPLGTVFKINTDGSGFATMHTFGGNDGANPIARLILSGNSLYGSTQQGGSSGSGTLFSININGTGFTNFYNFTTTTGPAQVNTDGASPWAPLFLSRNTLYGTAYSGGMFGFGTVFSVNPDGTGFTTIHSFSSANQPNQDGGNPVGGVILSGDTLYATAEVGGSGGAGTVFSVKTNGTAFFPLYNFSQISTLNAPNSDGAYPVAGLVLSGTTLYGTANTGGPSGYGSVFSVPIPAGPPELGISRSAANVIITWSTNITGFTLQSTTNLDSPSFWSTVSPGPTVVNGQNTVTNPISGNQQFYRLSQ